MSDAPEGLRPVKITKDYSDFCDGSVLIETGRTRVICGARIQHDIPGWKQHQGGGWVTAEYAMVPSSSPRRQRRDRFGYVDKRSLEIERMISRSLRAAVDFELLGERTIRVDCDVIHAAGGTRTASITGGWVAIWDAVEKLQSENLVAEHPVRRTLAAVSVGLSGGNVVVDLNYNEDSSADVDLNIVMSGDGEIAEIQGTAEDQMFSPDKLSEMVDAARSATQKLTTLQEQAKTTSTVSWNPDES